ncbi:MAG TPA: YciI family protein [Gaiellaceae bacterium]|jgi:hypothetical protein|nr:YciI family protein [Gaiellaceae bacterium]
MQYMLLIYNSGDWQDLSPEQQQEIGGAYFAFTEELQAAGKMVAGDALQPTSTATSVRVRDGETLTTDGPFAETKEVLGGYYLIDVESLDEALAWAAKIPGAAYGTIEVRPVVTDYETVA